MTIANDAALNLAAGSSLTIRASQVNINSGISAPSGTVNINSLDTTTHINGGGIQVADNVQFNVSGQWINDTEVANNVLPTNTLFLNAGTVSLNTTSTNGQLNVGNNVSFSADGGGWLKSSGTIAGGTGGSIALLSNGLDSSFYLGDSVKLSGYGVNGASGGTVSLAAGRVQITPRNTWADAQVYDPALTNSLWYFTISPQLFSDYGFSTFNITASGGMPAVQGDAMQVTGNSTINAVASTLLLSTQVATHRSGDNVHDFSTITTLPDYQRNVPSKINLNVAVSSIPGTTSGTLNIQPGSIISGDPGTQINLSSVNGSINIGGSLLAEAGSISAHIRAPSNAQDFPYDSQLGIVIGDHAVLDASGVFVDKPSDSGLLQGSLRDGGNIALISDMGVVTIANGAVVDVSGTSAIIDNPTGLPTTPYVRQRIGSNAGSITLSAAESVFIAGDSLKAAAGQSDSGIPFAGSLTIALNSNNYSSLNDITQSYPNSPRQVVLTNTTAVAPIDGIAGISVEQIKASGADEVNLIANDTVQIGSNVDLTLARTLKIDAPALYVNDGISTLNAGYVSIGNSLRSNTSATATHGNGALNINAGNVDIVGSSAIQNLQALNIVSQGDIRLNGVALQTAVQGELLVAGNMTLQASRLYGTTAAQFVINNQGYDVTLNQGAKSPGVPLSAASSITINADSVRQNGTLLAPFGQIAINANNISLGAGSITSVSAAGMVIPYGITDSNGKNWFYLGSTGAVTTLPDRLVSLKGSNKGSNDVSIASGAIIDLSGGGDLQAYEWIKGTGGSNDAFDFKLDPITG
ncbi:MAG: hypothetical protein ABUL58_04655, partial [Steroidobacter sp.]